jgi:hypothetical protein
MFERPGVPRHAYGAIVAALEPFDAAELRFRADQLARTFTERVSPSPLPERSAASPRPHPSGS